MARQFISLSLRFWLCAFAAMEARAQLAITEVLPNSSTNCVTATNRHPDFWELTNYGSDQIDLMGFRIFDSDDFAAARPLPDGLSIQPGTSIIFVRTHTTLLDPAAFRQWWWGSATGGPPVQIIFHESPGFDEKGEILYLWDAQGKLIDRMAYPDVPEFSGITLTVDSAGNTLRSDLDQPWTFRSATCADIGSPGFAPDRIALAISEQPRDAVVDAGTVATLRVRASGLPRPMSYEWYFNGNPLGRRDVSSNNVPLLINFAGNGLAWEALISAADLKLANVQPGQAGDYFVVVGNGLESQTSAVVTLTVNTNSTAARIGVPPDVTWFPTPDGSRETNLVVSEGQRATFGVFARGYPSPTFRWSRSTDGVLFLDIDGATNQLLVVENVQESAAGIYRVQVQNMHGEAYAYARLTLAPKARLRITEAMPLSRELGQHDWWELTNIGSEAVNLAGYQWNDAPGTIGGGPSITNAVVIEPGESIIFLESPTPDSFRAWWGPENLPTQLKFILYKANGLTETGGDQLNLWSHSADRQDDRIHQVVFAEGQAGTTYWFDVPICSGFYYGELSMNGSCGVFLARNGCDLGSPGWTRWTPPAFSHIQYTGSAVHLQWKAQSGSTNVVQYASALNKDDVWSTLGTFTFSTVLGTTIDTTIGSGQQRFYRILRMSEADCPCPEENENTPANKTIRR